MLLRTVPLRLRTPFRSAGGITDTRTVLLVDVEGEGVAGIAECVAGDSPHYSPETVWTARRVLERYLAPALLGVELATAEEAARLLHGTIRGHPMAKAALEMAVWDAEARSLGIPLAALLGGVREAVPAGVAVGLQSGVPALLERITAFLEEGYQRVKVKIEPGRDRDLLEAIRTRFPDTVLTVDANGSYTPAESGALEDLDRFSLGYLEQPFDPDDLSAHGELAERVRTPVCLDESIGSPARCRDALRLGACGVVNLKPGRVGGHAAARSIHDLCEAAEVPVWIGGMLESGVGRAHNVALASLSNVTLPGDLSASDRYWERDLVVPPFEVRPDGTVAVPTAPGIGVELDEDYIDHLATDRTELTMGGRG